MAVYKETHFEVTVGFDYAATSQCCVAAAHREMAFVVMQRCGDGRPSYATAGDGAHYPRNDDYSQPKDCLRGCHHRVGYGDGESGWSVDGE